MHTTSNLQLTSVLQGYVQPYKHTTNIYTKSKNQGNMQQVYSNAVLTLKGHA